MAFREIMSNEEKLQAKHEKVGQETDRKSYQDRLEAIRERKLKELK